MPGYNYFPNYYSGLYQPIQQPVPQMQMPVLQRSAAWLRRSLSRTRTLPSHESHKEEIGMDKMKELYDLCETIENEISEANEKIKKAGGKLSAGDVDYIDKLTHTMKSIKSVMSMMEEDEDDEYSSMYPYVYRGGRSYRGGSYRSEDGMMNEGGRSYARDGRGRGSNAKRDSMGRYSSRMDGYSRHGDVVESLREVMEEAPDDRTRMEIQRLIEKMEQR